MSTNIDSGFDGTCCEEERDLIELRRLYLDMIKKFIEICQSLEKLRTGTLAAKTTGVTVAALGATAMVGTWIAGLALAPISGGASLILAVGGSAMSAAGGITVAGSSIVNGIMSGSLRKDFALIQETLSNAARRSENTLARVWHKVTLLEKEGNNAAKALTFIFHCMKTGVKWENVNPHLLAVRVNEFFDKLEMESITMGATAKINTSVGASSALKGVAAGLSSAALTCADDILISVFQASKISIAGNAAKGIIGGVGAAFGAVFVVVDIVDLVKTYKKPDVLSTQIKKVIVEYKKRVEDCEKLIHLFQKA